jgi:hypothetical protein
LTTTRDVHQETVALLSDAVTDITRRAVEPTLAPFGAELRETVAALDVRLRTLDELLSDDRADRHRLTRQVSELPGLISGGADLVAERLDRAVTAIDVLRDQADENTVTLRRLHALVLGLTIGLAVVVVVATIILIAGA